MKTTKIRKFLPLPLFSFLLCNLLDVQIDTKHKKKVSCSRSCTRASSKKALSFVALQLVLVPCPWQNNGRDEKLETKMFCGVKQVLGQFFELYSRCSRGETLILFSYPKKLSPSAFLFPSLATL
jgi:hypothetical protein